MEPEPAPEPGWGLAHAGLALAAGFAASVVATNVWALAQGSVERTLSMTMVGLVALWSGYGAVMAATIRRRGGASLAAALRLRVRGPLDLVLGAAAGLGTALVLVPLLYAALVGVGLLGQGTVERLSEPAERLADTARGPGFLLLVILVGVGAPVVEECLFRGFLQPVLVKAVGAPAGVAAGAALFALVHFQALQFPALFVFGLVLGTLAHRTRGLGAPIAAHVVFNGLTLVSLAARA